MRFALLLFTSLFFFAACAACQRSPASQSVNTDANPAATVSGPIDAPDNPVTSPTDPDRTDNTPAPADPVEIFSPSPADTNKVRAPVYLDSVQLLVLESYPVQILLQLAGSLPTPCHKLRVSVEPHDNENRVYIDVYSVIASDVICIQVIEPFSKTISLGTFPTGHYQVFVNNEMIGDFDS